MNRNSTVQTETRQIWVCGFKMNANGMVYGDIITIIIIWETIIEKSKADLIYLLFLGKYIYLPTTIRAIVSVYKQLEMP